MKTKKRLTPAERYTAVMRCKCGEVKQAVADDIGVEYKTLWRWVKDYKDVNATVLLEMLKQLMVDHLTKDVELPTSFHSMVQVVKLALAKEDIDQSVEELEEMLSE